MRIRNWIVLAVCVLGAGALAVVCLLHHGSASIPAATNTAETADVSSREEARKTGVRPEETAKIETVKVAADGIAWGEAVNGLRVGLGQPKVARTDFGADFWLENVGGTAITLKYVQGIGCWQIVGRSADGKKGIKFVVTNYLPAPPILLLPVVLKPGEKRKLDMSYHNACWGWKTLVGSEVPSGPLPSDPRAYVFVATFESQNPQDAETSWRGKVSSGFVEAAIPEGLTLNVAGCHPFAAMQESPSPGSTK